MKFKDLFQEVEDWFWKLEFNPETVSYELYLGIPNDWIFSQKEDDKVKIELIHETEDNSIIKIYTLEADVTVDDVLDTGKRLILKNQELEKRKQEHREEMERLKDMLIEKEKNFLEYVDTVKENSIPEKETSEVINEGAIEGANEGASTFFDDIKKTLG